MRINFIILFVFLSLILPGCDDEKSRMPISTFQVDGVERKAIVIPGTRALEIPSPLIFAFHSFGSTSYYMALESNFHELWPEATVVYPQGLPVLKPSVEYWAPGWPDSPNQYDNRDIRFVEVMLEELSRQYRVDPHRVYAAGYSNGATFSYLLYAQRPTLFTAFAGVSGPASFLHDASKPRPILFISGEFDSYVPQEMSEEIRDQLLRVNQCGGIAAQWAPGYLKYTPLPGGAPVIYRRYFGGHYWPEDVNTDIIRFFKECAN